MIDSVKVLTALKANKESKAMAIGKTFGGLPPSAGGPGEAEVVVLPLPYERTVSYNAGTALGPAAILKASANMEMFDEELFVEPPSEAIYTADTPSIEELAPEKMLEVVRSEVSAILDSGRFLVSLGGEHSVTLPCVLATAERFRDLTVVQFDAHADLRLEYEGEKLSHACVMRNIFEMAKVEIIPIGIRSVCEEDYQFIRSRNLRPVWATDCDAGGKWIEKALSRCSENVYLSIDIDGLDSAVLPGTGTPEPGGLSYRQLLSLMRTLFRERNVIAMDVVEVMPVPGQVVSEFTAARIAYKGIVYRLFQDRL